MSKMSKEEIARFQGAAWALRMVEEKGLEAAQMTIDEWMGTWEEEHASNT